VLVGEVLQTLSDHGIKIKSQKCEWFQPKVEFLGHVVGSRGVAKTQGYIDKVDNFPRPENVRQLREFLGLVNFQRKFIPHASEVQKPLSSLSGGPPRQKLIWTPEMVNSFTQLKQLMKQEIELAFPNYDFAAEPLELWVDASQSGAGACLTQVQNGEPRIIAFTSMCFGPAQLNYSTLEKELAALRWGIKSFRAFLYGAEFVLHTDHQPLVYLHNMKLVDSRLARTLEDLADFNFVIRYTPGKLNVAADALSRLTPVMSGFEEGVPESSAALPPGLMLDGPPVPGGGNSLFEALLAGLQRTIVEHALFPLDHVMLRRLLVDELLEHPDRYSVKLNKQSKKDLRRMRFKDQLPSLELLSVAASVFEVSIYIYFWSPDPVVFQMPR
jgi:hypothetical protein